MDTLVQQVKKNVTPVAGSWLQRECFCQDVSKNIHSAFASVFLDVSVHHVHLPDKFKFLLCPLLRTGNLIAAIASGRRIEERFCIHRKCDCSAWGEDEGIVALYSMNDGKRIPHLLSGVAVLGRSSSLQSVSFVLKSFHFDTPPSQIPINSS